jgi:hypothetical protein
MGKSGSKGGGHVGKSLENGGFRELGEKCWNSAEKVWVQQR